MSPVIWKLHCIKSQKGWYVSGTVLKKTSLTQDIEGSWWGTFKNTVKTYFSKPYRGSLRLFWNGDSLEVETDGQGKFSFITKNLDPSTLSFETTTGASVEQIQSYPTAFDMERAPYIVISDIDDTILVSKSEKFFSKIWLMLFRQTAKRNFVEESEKAYRRLSTAGTPFAYISASEQNLFATITNFLIFHELPLGPIFLRPYTHWKDLLKAKARENYKVDRMTTLIAHFPETRFALFGDDSQQDPLAFKSILEIYPEQIDAIFIRKTGSGNNVAEIKKLKTLTEPNTRFSHYSEFEDIEPIINKIARDYPSYS
jgi:phosphatidate phosphatase APP1